MRRLLGIKACGLEQILVVVERNRVGCLRHAVVFVVPHHRFQRAGKIVFRFDDRGLPDHVRQVQKGLTGREHGMVGIVDGDDVRRLAGREGAHGLAHHIVELKLAIFDLDTVILRVEFLDEVRCGLDIAVQRPENEFHILRVRARTGK